MLDVEVVDLFKRYGSVAALDGVVARPYFWVQSRAALHYQPAEPRRTFTPTVVRAVRQAPF